MSQVNDALKRAKQAVRKNEAPAVTPMRPVEDGRRARGTNFLLAMLALVILLLAALLLWQWLYSA